MRTGLEPCRSMPGVRDVRVLGAIGVVELEAISDLVALQAALVDRGLWVRPFRSIVYLTPAFTISPDDLSALTDGVVEVLNATIDRRNL
jgi:adenosylmethionine-8-amino-7-oxononanoate aminotransferase